MMLLRQVRWFGANGRRALDALRATSALDWQFSRASGPGGQHVNKVNTRAELRLDLDHATQSRALPRDVADRLTKHSTIAADWLTKMPNDDCNAILSSLSNGLQSNNR